MREKKTPHPVFKAIKALEGDSLYAEENTDIAESLAAIRGDIALDPILEGDFEAAVADVRYKYITEHCRQLLKRAGRTELTYSDKIDAVLTHKLFGLPIFFLFYRFIMTDNISSIIHKPTKDTSEETFLKGFFLVTYVLLIPLHLAAIFYPSIRMILYVVLAIDGVTALSL